MSMQISIRKAEASDVLDVFNLSNKTNTRKYSINQNKILWDEHLGWFDEVLKSDKIILYIISDENNKFLGQVRFNINSESAEISISIVDDLKGKGYSMDILLRSQMLITEEKNIDRISAIIHNENKPSLKLFKKAGYKFLSSENKFSEYVLDI